MLFFSANYMKARLENHYKNTVQWQKNNTCAHEFIGLTCARLKIAIGIEVEDVAKRLMDYGFHAPTLSSELLVHYNRAGQKANLKLELDRFCGRINKYTPRNNAIETGAALWTDNGQNPPASSAARTTGDEMEASIQPKFGNVLPLEFVIRENKFGSSAVSITIMHGDRGI